MARRRNSQRRRVDQPDAVGAPRRNSASLLRRPSGRSITQRRDTRRPPRFSSRNWTTRCVRLDGLPSAPWRANTPRAGDVDSQCAGASFAPDPWRRRSRTKENEFPASRFRGANRRGVLFGDPAQGGLPTPRFPGVFAWRRSFAKNSFQNSVQKNVACNS